MIKMKTMAKVVCMMAIECDQILVLVVFSASSVAVSVSKESGGTVVAAHVRF